MKRALGILLVASLLGCASNSGVKQVHVTRNVADVEHCKAVGAVQTLPPYAMPGDDIRQIRDRTVAVGADTVLLNTSRVTTAGVAYRCRSS